MDTDKNVPRKQDDGRLRNYSEVKSFERLSDRDSEIASEIIAGGDELLIDEDFEE